MSDAFLGTRDTYDWGVLDASDLDPDPIRMLAAWIDHARAHDVIEPTAMCLSTVADNGQPSSRMVLLRTLDVRGLVFFTNYLSRKGEEIAKHPRACVNFWWGSLQRQVRVEGLVSRTTPHESDVYFDGRPRGSQAASVASPQSQEVADRAALERAVAEIEASGEAIRRPAHWGGYLLAPTLFEFWQGRPSRMHDRFVYEVGDEGWEIRRLAP